MRTVLVVTGDQSFAATAGRQLGATEGMEVLTAGSVKDAMRTVLSGSSVDCIVSDHDLGDIDGIAFLETVRAHSPFLPFIIFTSEGDEHLASRAITAGVTDYLIKERHADQWDRLRGLISDAVQYHQTRQGAAPVEHRAEVLLDNSFDVIAVVQNGQFDYVNLTGIDLLGLEGKEAIIGEPVGEWIETVGGHPIERDIETAETESGSIRHREAILIGEDTRRIPVELTATNITWREEPAAVLVGRDRREEKFLEWDLALKERAMAEAPVGVTIADATKPDDPLIYVNEHLQEMTGYAAEEFLGRNCRMLQGPETDPEPVERMRQAIDTGQPVTVELRNYRKNGEQFWNRVSIAPIRDEDGSITHYVGFQQEITEKKEHERTLARLQQAVEAAGHAIYMTDPEGTISYVNPAFEEITGYAAEEAVGSNPRILNSGEIPEAYFEDLWRTVRRGETWNELIINRRKDGEVYHAEQTIAPVFDPDDTIAGYVAIQTDITERREATESLAQYKQAVESSKDLIAAIDEEWNFLFANEMYREYHDIEDVDVRSLSLPEVLGPETFEAFKPDIQAAQNGVSIKTEIARTHPTKGDRILDVRLFPLVGPDGSIHGNCASMRDITEQRKREERIRRESALRQILSEVNHRIVRGSDIEKTLSVATEILGESEEFTCTFTVLLETVDTNVVCTGHSGLTEEIVQSYHFEEYVDAVLEDGYFHMEDVTQGEFKQHEEERPPHHGVGVAISHGDIDYGVLTVHFPPGTEPSEEDRQVLETIGADLGYFITHQRLRSEAKSFADIVERIDDPVMLQDRDGSFSVVNEVVTDLAEMEKSALIGQTESAFMDEEAAERIAEMKALVIETGEPVVYKIEPTFPDGRTRTFSTTRYPYYDDDGRLDGTLAICRDVTDLEEHQQQLRVMDRVLRHNVNNNMNVIRGFAEMIQDETGGSIREYAERIVQNSDQLLDIAQKQRKITEFLSDPDPIEQFDLGAAIDQIVDRIRSTHPTASISVERPDRIEVSAVRAIEDAIEELLTNSIIHAKSPSPKPSVRVHEREGTVQIRVVDQNEAIASIDRQVLSGGDDLSTLRHGSGLGLGLVRLIVEYSNGEISHETRDPRGNVLTITLEKP